MTTRKKEIDTTNKQQCTRCKVWKLVDDFSPKKEGMKKYCNHCLDIAKLYRNKKKLIRINIHNLSDEEKKEIIDEINNVSE